jgi:serine/threonine protein phosphatase 1
MFRKRSPSPPAAPARIARLQPGYRAYVIGDIHGRADLLGELLAVIKTDAMMRPGPGTNVVVYLGDYVDRGPQSREVIDLIVSNPLPDFAEVRLLGNHDDTLLRFLEDPAIGPTWSSYGGDATLLSYGAACRCPASPATISSSMPACGRACRWKSRRRPTCCGSATTSSTAQSITGR